MTEETKAPAPLGTRELQQQAVAIATASCHHPGAPSLRAMAEQLRKTADYIEELADRYDTIG